MKCLLEVLWVEIVKATSVDGFSKVENSERTYFCCEIHYIRQSLGGIFISKNVIKLVLLKCEETLRLWVLSGVGPGTRWGDQGPHSGPQVGGNGIHVSTCQNSPDRSEAALGCWAAGSPRLVKVRCACLAFSAFDRKPGSLLFQADSLADLPELCVHPAVQSTRRPRRWGQGTKESLVPAVHGEGVWGRTCSSPLPHPGDRTAEASGNADSWAPLLDQNQFIQPQCENHPGVWIPRLKPDTRSQGD